MFNVGGGDEEEEDNSLTATFEGNIYDVSIRVVLYIYNGT